MGIEFELPVMLGLCLAFFVGGFVDSIAGGGGLINIPAFLLAGAPPEFALGTTKMSATIGKIAALINYAKNGFVHWKVSLVGLPAAIIGSAIGTKVILLFESVTIGRIVIFLLPLGVLAVLLPRRDFGALREISPLKLYIFTPLICFILGFYDGFFGPGVGSFFIIALNIFIGLSLVQAAATTKVFNLTTAFSSFVVFALNGKVLYLVGIPLAIASIAGNTLGSSLAIKIGAKLVKRILLLSLSLLFVTLVWKFFF